MKKLLSLLLAAAMLLCAGSALAEGEGYEIAMITDVGNIDDQSFNQSTWEGVMAYAEANSKTYAYYRPSEDSTEARVESIKASIDKGAKIVVCPGYLFADALAEVQDEYPEVQFIVIDTAPANGASANTCAVFYQEEQAGYFAGYAAVKDGYTKLGFLGGMAVPAVVRYGYGYVQGADVAAKELGVQIDIKYWYCDAFDPSDDIKSKMSAWYADGTEIVFACGGKIYLSATAAAEEAGAKVIGVDTDQYYVSETVLTSAFKDIKNTVIMMLDKIYGNEGKLTEDMAGQTLTLGANDACVGLPTAETSWRFATYTVAEYEAAYELVKSGDITISADIDSAPVTTNSTVDYQN